MAFFVPIISEDENSQHHGSRYLRTSLLIAFSLFFLLGFFALYLVRSNKNNAIPAHSSEIMPIYLSIVVISAIVLTMVVFLRVFRHRNQHTSHNVGISSTFHEPYTKLVPEQPYRPMSQPKCYSCGESIEFDTMGISQDQKGVYCTHCGVYIELP